ncbi:NAD(P)-binding protein [Wallemia mellicola]|nr:NAD(P)-binding protein [Wallemia mellicola]
MSTFRQLKIYQTGGLDKLVLDDKSTLKPLGPHSLNVKVSYAGVNYIDNYFRSGLYPVPLPFNLGQEGAGKIVEVGSEVTQFKPGQSVAFYSPGSLSEYQQVDQSKAVLLDRLNVTEKVAATGLLQGLTAWTFLREAYQVKKGDKILVHSAAGGVGLLLVQLAKHLGAYVIGTTSTPEKAQLAKQNGADEVILYTKEDTVARVLELTNGEGVIANYDGVGKDTFDLAFEVAARRGTIISFGNASGAVEPFSILKLTAKNIKLLRPSVMNYIATAEELNKYASELFDLIGKGVVKLHTHGVYDFTIDSLRQAQADITSRNTTGKLIVKVSDE